MTDSELDQVYQRTMAKMRQAIEQGVGAVKLPLPHISDTASDKMGSEKSEKIKPKDSEEKEKVDAENLPASVETPEAPASIEPIEIAKPEEPKAEADVEKKEGEYVESKDTASAVAETVEIPSAVEVALGDSSAEQIETSVEQISPVAESPRADSDEKVVDAGLVEEEVTETTVHVAVSPSESSKPQTEKVDAVQEEQSVTPTSPVETAEVTDVPSSESAMPAVLPVEQEPEKQSQVEQPEAEGSSVEVTAVGKAPAHALEEKLGSSEQKAADDTQHISPVDSGVGASIEDSVAAAPASGPVPAPTLTPESTEDVPASGAERSSSTETLLTIPSVEPPEVPEPKTVPRPAGSDDGRGTRVRTLWTELDRLSIRSAPVFKRVKFSPPSLADDLDGLNDDVSSIASDERSESSSNLISEAPSDSSYISATNEAELNVVEVRKAALRMMVLLRDLESAAESLASSAKTAPAPPSRSAAPAAASPLATKPPIGLGLLLQDAMSSAGPVSASTSPEAAVLRLAREAYQVAESFGKLCGLEGLSDKKKTRSPGQVSRVSMASRPPPARTHAPSLREMVGRQALMGGPLGPAGTGMGLPYAGMGLRRPGYAASVV